jgi:hypothetical protein
MNSYVDGWAVGGPSAGQTGSSALYRWDGSTWTSYSTASIPNTVLYNSVTCFTYSDCFAVGMAPSGATNPSIIMWNGTSWATPTFAGTTSGDNLYAVACSPTTCWAVGDNASKGVFYSSSNGTTWTGVAVNAALNSFAYKGVACPSASSCWAVGANNIFAFYNGTTWAPVTTPLPSTATYFGVWCNSTTDCWAAGDSGTIGHWNGTAWSQVASPIDNSLRYISCVNSNNCFMSTAGNFFIHWDGNAWSLMTVNGSVPSIEFDGIAVVGPTSNAQSTWAENFH